MSKIDFKKTLACYKANKGKIEIIEVPELQYLMVDGHGDPNTSKEFKDAVETLFPIAYKLKFMSKIDLKKDYAVMPLEGLWWAKDMEKFTSARDKSDWDWTLMIMTPDWITKEMFEQAKVVVKDKNLAKINEIRLETLKEGKCVQTLHIGSFDEEGPVLKHIHSEFIPQNGLKMVQKHYEIYFSDFRKVSPDKMKTILRQPVI